MNPPPEKSGEASKTVPPLERFNLPNWLWWLREAISAAIWSTYVASWFYDIRGAIAELSPALLPIYDYRFLILIGLFLFTWAFISFPRAVSFLFIVAYPVIWLGRVLKVLLRNFKAALIFSPTFYSIAKPFKLNVLLLLMTLVSFISVLFSRSPTWITAGMVGLGIYILSHYLRRFHHAFASSTVFSVLCDRVPRAWAQAKDKLP